MTFVTEQVLGLAKHPSLEAFELTLAISTILKQPSGEDEVPRSALLAILSSELGFCDHACQ